MLIKLPKLTSVSLTFNGAVLWSNLLETVTTALTPGGGVLAEKLGRGVRPASQNPYPIYDQNLRFSLPYL